MKINLRQNQNEESKVYGKYFCEPDSNEPLSTKGFARHLSEHGKLASYDMLVLVLSNVVGCMKELLTQGIPVKLDGLGTFYPTALNVKGGLEDVAAAKDMAPSAAIEGIRVRYLPDGTKLDDLTSKAFKEKCSLVWGNLIEITGYKTSASGKTKSPLYKLTPISNPLSADPAPQP